MTMSTLSLLPVALRASLSILLFLPFPASSSPIVTPAAATPRPAVVFTPPGCIQGRTDSAHLPVPCDDTWFTVVDADNRTVHASRSATSRAVLHFTGVAISWLSTPVTTTCGSADIFLNTHHVERVQLSPDNTRAGTPSWSAAGLDPHTVHNLTIVPVGDDVVYVRELTVVPAPNTNDLDLDDGPPSASAPLLAATSSPLTTTPPVLRLASQDPSSGTVISLASIGSVAMVVLICGGCFILGKRQKSPGFHMPTILVDIEAAMDTDGDGGDSPTSTRRHDPYGMGGRAWPGDSTERENGEAAENRAYDERRYQYPPSGASCLRPPSYRSGKDSLFRSDSSKSYRGDSWQQ